MTDIIRTESIENFLKAVYNLQQNEERVRTNHIASALGIKAASANDFINRCQEAGLLEHVPHRGVKLTEAGEKIVMEVLRHHRLLELFLVIALGYTWDEVHEEAEKLEHHISEKLEARIAAYLGNPTIDPHGDPIPSADGSLPELGLMPLADLPLETSSIVSRLLDQTAENLRYLESKGLILGAQIRILKREPFDNLTHIEIDGQQHVIGENTVRQVMVKSPAES